ncbi:glycoside hydrolase domain-containing protein [Parabacteroides sp. Marseille-P3160]|uniref:glycoside hydrolase domain-containing protein n=1 Tax=Bacteroidales TaxID=171549 RepID=UPI0009BA0164|nr:glycoside hydrolase domain-containing protein [Parabacteroides sp. Marseille-P3160]
MHKNKKNRLLFLFVAMITVILNFSCKSDTDDPITEEAVKISFSQYGVTDVFVDIPQEEVIFHLGLAKDGNSSKEIEVNLSVLSEKELKDYNTLHSTNFDLLPGSCYNMNQLMVKFKPSDKAQQLQTTLYRDQIKKLNLSQKQYALPIKINETAERVEVDKSKSIILIAPSLEQLLHIYQIDALEKVIPDQSLEVDVDNILHVAQGEYATLQLVVSPFDKIDNRNIDVQINHTENSTSLNAKIERVGYVGASNRFILESNVIIKSSTNQYPDPIFPIDEVGYQSYSVQPLWITTHIPLETPSGLYKGVVKVAGFIDGKSVSTEKLFYIKVYPVAVREISLLTTNWYYLDSPTLAYMNNKTKVDMHSDLYWQLVRKFAEVSAEYKNNVHFINLFNNIQFTLSNGKYGFNFDNFDKELLIFERAGALKRIEGGQLGYRFGAPTNSLGVYVPILDGSEISIRLLSLSDQRSQDFYNQFLPALKQHLKDRGWHDIYMQHIVDEPGNSDIQSYLEISDFVKKHMKEVPILEAILTTNGIQNGIDIMTPQVNTLGSDYESVFKPLIDQGKEVWFYTCTGPQGNYVNRFIQLPLIQMRIMHWINFKYKASGYLHWGGNSWTAFDDPYKETTNLSNDWPGGDSYIVYPGYGKLYPSIRMSAMRDGIYDYELLKMLDQKNPAAAQNIVNKVVFSNAEYDNTIPNFRNMRKQILESLSE